MNDVRRRQAVAARQLCLTGGAAAQGATFGKKFGSGGAMDRAVDSTPAEQRTVRGALTIASTASRVMSPLSMQMREWTTIALISKKREQYPRSRSLPCL